MSSNTNRDRVAAAFLHGGYARSGHFAAMDGRAYSYAHRLGLMYPATPYSAAYVELDQSCDQCHSRTTATHAAAIRRALEARRWQLESASDEHELWTKPMP